MQPTIEEVTAACEKMMETGIAFVNYLNFAATQDWDKATQDHLSEQSRIASEEYLRLIRRLGPENS